MSRVSMLRLRTARGRPDPRRMVTLVMGESMMLVVIGDFGRRQHQRHIRRAIVHVLIVDEEHCSVEFFSM
jgi:hypothetical protein